MYDHERSLVNRLRNRPFALIGVNTDITQDKARRAVTTEHLTWRSFFDGSSGPIVKQWHVMTFPTILLIDHKGIIRGKFEWNPGDAVLDREIDDLVKEAENSKRSEILETNGRQAGSQ